MTDVPVCPECDRSNPYHRRPSVQGRDHTHEWRCEDPECDARFDDPEWRAPKSRDSIPGGSLADKLDKADPEEVGP